MIVGRFFEKIGRGPDGAAAILAAIGVTTVPRPANAGGISPGAAGGIGLGAFVLPRTGGIDCSAVINDAAIRLVRQVPPGPPRIPPS